MSSKLLRYAIWSIIAVLFFSLILLLFFNTPAMFYAAAAIVILGLLKDSIDYYRMANGQDALGGHYVEHLPLMIIVLIFSAFMLSTSKNIEWLIVVIGSIIDSVIDFEQDLKCC